MSGKPVKLGVLGGVLALALVYSGVGYVSGAVPFPVQQRGDLGAADVCGSLGDGKTAAAELKTVLPARAAYSSRETNPPRVRDETSWRADCTVSGDGDQLLYASAELGWDASPSTWLDDPTRLHVDDEGRGEEFRAGSAAVVMRQTAEILVPCVARKGTAPYGLVVVVHAQKPLVGSARENRHALAVLALGSARSAHERAKCPMPSRVPAKVVGLH